MAKNTNTIEDSLDGELPGIVVGAIKNYVEGFDDDPLVAHH